jgi:hypothetical protein
VLIAIGAVVFSVIPYRASIPVRGGALLPLRTSCSAPITEAWRTQTTRWVGYAPLSEASLPEHVGCREPARTRLRWSAAAMSLALVAVVAALLLRRRPGDSSHHRRFAV